MGIFFYIDFVLFTFLILSDKYFADLHAALGSSLITNQYLNPVKFYCILKEKNLKIKNQLFNLIFYTHSIHGWFLSRKFQTSFIKRCLDWIFLGTLPTF